MLSYMLFSGNTPRDTLKSVKIKHQILLTHCWDSIAQIMDSRDVGLNQELLTRERLDGPHTQVTVYLYSKVNST